jgi:hypothetical protein
MALPLALGEKFPAVVGNIIQNYGSRDWKAEMDWIIKLIKLRINPSRHDADMAEAWRRPEVAKKNMWDFIASVESYTLYEDDNMDSDAEESDHEELLSFYRGERRAYLDRVLETGPIGYGRQSANFGPSCRYQW